MEYNESINGFNFIVTKMLFMCIQHDGKVNPGNKHKT